MRFKDLSRSARQRHLEASFHDAIQALDRMHPDKAGLHGHERIAGFLNVQCAGMRHDMSRMAQLWAQEHGHQTPEAVTRFVDERMAQVCVPQVTKPHS
jgi:hypothetical protein